MTVFLRMEHEDKTVPFIYDYQIKGFLKDAWGMLQRVPGNKCADKSVRAYKKIIDGLVFPQPRQIPLILPAGTTVGTCQRPLRAQTPLGERVALANSETVPIGTTLTFTITLLDEKIIPQITECLTYGALRGLGQWRNSGKGRFSCTITAS